MPLYKVTIYYYLLLLFIYKNFTKKHAKEFFTVIHVKNKSVHVNFFNIEKKKKSETSIYLFICSNLYSRNLIIIKTLKMK